MDYVCPQVGSHVDTAQPSRTDGVNTPRSRWLNPSRTRSALSPKVFKGKELALAAEETATIRKTISLAQHSTRKHYAGIHRVEVLINGATHVGGTFYLD